MKFNRFRRLAALVLDRLGFYLSKISFLKHDMFCEAYDKIRGLLTPSGQVWVRFRGYDILIDTSEYVGGEIYNGEFHEDELESVMRNEIDEGSTVIDVGAHVGALTLVLRDIVGSDGEVISFEPFPQNYGMLTKTVRRNDFENVECYNQALYSRNGEKTLFFNLENTGGASIEESSKARKLQVELINSEEFLAEHNIDWMKLDVQGAEYEIIKSISKYLDNLEGLFVEVHPSILSDSELKDLYSILLERGSLTDLNNNSISENEFSKSNGSSYIWRSNCGES
jgi:FkbM family methyltransferase